MQRRGGKEQDVEKYVEYVVGFAEWIAARPADQDVGPGLRAAVDDRMLPVPTPTPPRPLARGHRPTHETIRAQCQAIADAAAPEDSYRAIAAKVESLSERQVQRRIEAMERELGMQPAERAELGGGRRPQDGSSVRHAGPYRRAGAVARTWRRRCTEDCL